jgi:hypothetical protein
MKSPCHPERLCHPERSEGSALAVLALVLLSTAASAQSLESRINAANGSVAFNYATRPNVCGNGSGIEISEDSSDGWTYRSNRRGVHYGTRYGGREDRCETGPALVVLRRSGGEVTELRLTVGGGSERADFYIADVKAADAAAYLLKIAPHLSGRAGDRAVLGAVVADGVVAWPTLLTIARASDASESSRKAAIFWLSHEASAVATRGIDSLATDDDTSLALRKDALFYIAQRRNGEGIPALVKVAETSKSMVLRKDAIFFLAQSHDERALALFEKLLAGR